MIQQQQSTQNDVLFFYAHALLAVAIADENKLRLNKAESHVKEHVVKQVLTFSQALANKPLAATPTIFVVCPCMERIRLILQESQLEKPCNRRTCAWFISNNIRNMMTLIHC